jgi:hypothetical protein
MARAAEIEAANRDDKFSTYRYEIFTNSQRQNSPRKTPAPRRATSRLSQLA